MPLDGPSAGPFDVRQEPTPGAENKPVIIPTETQNFKVFVDAPETRKEGPVFPAK